MQIHPIACGLGYAFLIETESGLCLVDSGSPDEEQRVLACLRALGRSDLKLIWITHAHYDHYGSAAALRRLTGAKIGVHPADADSLSCARSPLGSWRSYGWIYRLAQPLVNRFHRLTPAPPDFTLADGQALPMDGLAARVVHTPGHTPGHTCLLLADGACFAGDLLGAWPCPGLQHLLATDWQQLPASLEHLRAARPQWLYTGHSARRLAAADIWGRAAG